MNLVGFGLTLHDSSVAAYKDGKFLYRKAERQFNKKHAYGSLDWAKSVLKEWDITDYELAISTWLKHPDKNCMVLPKKNFYLLDHHYSHQLSASNPQSSHLIYDTGAKGPGGLDELTPYSGLMNGIRIQELNPSQFLTHVVRSKFFNHVLVDYTVEELHELMGEVCSVYEHKKDPSTHKNWNLFTSLIDIPGKVMGLQAYGKPNLHQIAEWSQRTHFRNMTVSSEILARSKDEFNYDYVSTIHKFCEGLVLEKAAMLGSVFNYAGGIAQNVVWNRALLDAGNVPMIDPWAYDGGCSIGALNYLLKTHDIERHADWVQDDEAPEEEPDVWTTIKVAQLIADNKVVGWYQGNGEVGPRALGNRSILYNPADKNAKDKVNKIKQREWWRPFGASVTEDEASKFFDLPKSRHMLYNSNVLYSGIPGVTHVDGTCRHQTVPSSDDPFYYLLEYVKLETGLPIVLNTSLNARGKPICSTIKQALDIFKTTEMDAICIGNEVYTK